MMLIECGPKTLNGIYLGGDLDGEFLFLDEELGLIKVHGWNVEMDIKDVQRIFKQTRIGEVG